MTLWASEILPIHYFRYPNLFLNIQTRISNDQQIMNTRKLSQLSIIQDLSGLMLYKRKWSPVGYLSRESQSASLITIICHHKASVTTKPAKINFIPWEGNNTTEKGMTAPKFCHTICSLIMIYIKETVCFNALIHLIYLIRDSQNLDTL